MFLAYRSHIFLFACTLIITCNLVSSDYIPCLLWNINGNALHVKPVSALGHNDKIFLESLKDIHHQESSILVFAVNKLSLEDFSANDRPLSINNTLSNVETILDSQPHLLLPSVKDPLNYIHKAHCGVQEIVVDHKIDESVMQSVSSALQRSCVVILHISDDGIVVKEDEIKTVFLPTFENSNKNIVGVFTGVQSSWGAPNNEHHVFRNLLATAPSDDNFLNITGCIIMYAENATIIVGKESNSSVTLPFSELNTNGSSCDNDTILQLNFKTSGILSSVSLKLTFEQKRNAWKTTATVSLTGEKKYPENIDLIGDLIEAPLGFSFSCGDLVLKNNTYELVIKIRGFQVQPYEVKGVFSDSFDCVPYFTVPIWMGIFVSILFIVITNIGVYALFAVRTMDRFDDPKGKTIAVGTTAD